MPLLAPTDIGRYYNQSPVSYPAAHRFLSKLRDRHRDTMHNVFLHDLTDSHEFDWKVWVALRGDVKDIVGTGIYRFAFVWLSSMDTNLKERRGDFMVSRIDGEDIRLHPQSNKNARRGRKRPSLCGVRGSSGRPSPQRLSSTKPSVPPLPRRRAKIHRFRRHSHRHTTTSRRRTLSRDRRRNSS